MEVTIRQKIELEEVVKNVFVVKEDGKWKINVSWNDCVELAKKMSESDEANRAGKNFIFRLLTLQESYDLTHKNKVFKEKITKSYWIRNAEQIHEKDVIKNDTIIDNLIRNKKFKNPKEKVYKGGIYFDENGKASVRSYWSTVVGCFYADADRPANRSEIGLAVFLKENRN